MELAFERTGKRRYAIHAIRPGLPAAIVEPAPGYDPLLPHDVMHMVVEAELGLTRGVFGQLAAGGLAGTFRIQPDTSQNIRAASRLKRRAVSRDKSLLKEGLKDSEKSERATYLCWYEWLARSENAIHRKTARSMAPNAKHIRDIAPAIELAALTEPVMDRICAHLDTLSSRWSGLDVGESMRVQWPELTVSE